MSESRLNLTDCLGTGTGDDPFRQPIEVAGAKVGLVDWRPDPTRPEGSFIVMVTAPASVHAKIAEPFLPLFANADRTGHLGLDDPLSLVHKSFWPAIVDMLEERGAPIDEVVAAKSSWRYRDLAALACRHALHRQFKQGQGVVLPWAEESPTRLKALLGRDLKDLPAGRLGDLRDWLKSKSFEVTREFVLSATVRELLNRMGRDLIAPELTGRRDGRWRIFMGDKQPLWVSAKSTGAREGSVQHTESFDKANSTILGPDLSWTEIGSDWEVNSNIARMTVNWVTAQARADHAMDTDDILVQATVTQRWDFSSSQTGLISRMDNIGTDTYYLFSIYGSSHNSVIQKVVAGSLTTLANNGTPYSGYDPGWMVLRGEVEGSAQRNFIDDTQYSSASDAAISGDKYGGLWGTLNWGGHPQWNDFTIQDLGFGVGIVHLDEGMLAGGLQPLAGGLA